MISALKGDMESFGKFYSEMYNVIYLYGKHFSTQEQELEDTIQGFFLKILQSPQAYIDSTDIKSYTLKSFRNFYLNKKRGQKDLALLNKQDDNQVNNIEDIICAEESLSIIEQYGSQLLEGMSEREREIIYLRYYCDLNSKEISESLNINYQVVRNLLHRCIKKIRTNLNAKKKIKGLLQSALKHLNIFF